MTLNAAGVLTVSSGVNNEGETLIGTKSTFTPADATPDVSGSSYWASGGAVTITNFTGVSVAGTTFILEVAHTVTIGGCGSNFYCGAGYGENIVYQAGDFVTWIYRSDGFWAILNETFFPNEHSQTLTFFGDEIVATNDVGMVRIPDSVSQAVLQRFSCVAEGGSTAALDVYIEDCTGSMGTCAATGATLAISTNGTDESDTTFDDDINVGGRWWAFRFGTVTTAPDRLTCQISYDIH
jgi:hypothetical protein